MLGFDSQFFFYWFIHSMMVLEIFHLERDKLAISRQFSSYLGFLRYSSFKVLLIAAQTSMLIAANYGGFSK